MKRVVDQIGPAYAFVFDDGTEIVQARGKLTRADVETVVAGMSAFADARGRDTTLVAVEERQ